MLLSIGDPELESVPVNVAVPSLFMDRSIKELNGIMLLLVVISVPTLPASVAPSGILILLDCTLAVVGSSDEYADVRVADAFELVDDFFELLVLLLAYEAEIMFSSGISGVVGEQLHVVVMERLARGGPVPDWLVRKHQHYGELGA